MLTANSKSWNRLYLITINFLQNVCPFMSEENIPTFLRGGGKTCQLGGQICTHTPHPDNRHTFILVQHSFLPPRCSLQALPEVSPQGTPQRWPGPLCRSRCNTTEQAMCCKQLATSFCLPASLDVCTSPDCKKCCRASYAIVGLETPVTRSAPLPFRCYKGGISKVVYCQTRSFLTWATCPWFKVGRHYSEKILLHHREESCTGYSDFFFCFSDNSRRKRFSNCSTQTILEQ